MADYVTQIIQNSSSPSLKALRNVFNVSADSENQSSNSSSVTTDRRIEVNQRGSSVTETLTNRRMVTSSVTSLRRQSVTGFALGHITLAGMTGTLAAGARMSAALQPFFDIELSGPGSSLEPNATYTEQISFL